MRVISPPDSAAPVEYPPAATKLQTFDWNYKQTPNTSGRISIECLKIYVQQCKQTFTRNCEQEIILPLILFYLC